MNAKPTCPASRREFLKTTGRLAAASALAGVALPHVHAAEDNTLRLALIGCGGRGSGAAANAPQSPGGPTRLVAMADLFPDKLSKSHANLAEQFGDKVDVPRERRFLGFDAYRKAMDCLRPGDIALCTTHAAFRPAHPSGGAKPLSSPPRADARDHLGRHECRRSEQQDTGRDNDLPFSGSRFMQAVEAISCGRIHDQRLGRAIVLNATGDVAPVHGTDAVGVLLQRPIGGRQGPRKGDGEQRRAGRSHRGNDAPKSTLQAVAASVSRRTSLRRANPLTV